MYREGLARSIARVMEGPTSAVSISSGRSPSAQATTSGIDSAARGSALPESGESSSLMGDRRPVALEPGHLHDEPGLARSIRDEECDNVAGRSKARREDDAASLFIQIDTIELRADREERPRA